MENKQIVLFLLLQILKSLISSAFKWSCIVHDDSIAMCLQIIQVLSMTHAVYKGKVKFYLFPEKNKAYFSLKKKG